MGIHYKSNIMMIIHYTLDSVHEISSLGPTLKEPKQLFFGSNRGLKGVLSGFDLFFVDLIGESRTHIDGTFGIEFSRLVRTTDRVDLVAEDVDVLGSGFERVLFHLTGTQNDRVDLQEALFVLLLAVLVCLAALAGYGVDEVSIWVDPVVGLHAGYRGHFLRILQARPMDPSGCASETSTHLTFFPLHEVDGSFWRPVG